MEAATAAAFTLLLVQDHLKYHGMFDTLAAFSKEVVAKAASASPDVWYEMAHAIGIHGLKHEHPHESTLTALVHVAVLERQTRLRTTAPCVIRITPKASRHRTSTTKDAASTPLQTSASSPSLRPKSASAAVVTSSASTPTLGTQVSSPSRAAALDHRSSGTTTNQQDNDDSTKPQRGDVRLLKYMNLKQRETRAQLPQLKAIETAKKEILQVSTSKTNAAAATTNATGPAPSPGCSSSSSLLIENAAAGQWMSDDVRLRQVRRGLAHVQEELHVHNTYERVLKHNGVGKVILPPPKERAILACSLCLHPFQKHNLPHQVPYKAVMDLRRLWDPHMNELNPTRARPPTCYDLVRICVFCAQFVQESERYRPEEGTAAVDVQAKMTNMSNAMLRRSTTVEEKAINDPFSCDPILDGDDDAVLLEAATSLDSRYSIGGLIGKNIRYQMQNAHTVRNLSEAEWGVISISKRKSLAEMNGTKTSAVVDVDEIRRSMPMKRLLMDATKLASLTEPNSGSCRPSPVSTDRRHTTEERITHNNNLHR